MRNNELLLLNQKCAHTLSFYDLASGKAVKHIRLPDFPHEMVVDSNNRFAYVAHYGIESIHHSGNQGGCSVFVIDLITGEHVRTLNTWPFYRIHGLAMDNQDRLYAMSEGHSTLLIFDDPENTDEADRAVPSGGYKTHLFALSRDGETAFGINLLSHTVTLIKPQDPTFTPVSVNPGRKPEGNRFSADEKTLFVANRTDNSIVAIDVETLQITHIAPTGEDPTRIYLDPCNRLIVTNYGENSLALFDQQLASLGSIELEYRPVALAFHPDGKHAFVTFVGDKLGVLNLDRQQIIRYFNTLDTPDVVTFLPPI
ncbi:YncE family protein [Aliamphritea hakodatensis]|uniref:YncE family protein n=1 Tax=Aliamphritea hakodatensis TaxID=2895352 RepID=UPI0022FD64CE|nr:beta-propeller fold lactonase family protein [Aliamphritea hakodatensis]